MHSTYKNAPFKQAHQGVKRALFVEINLLAEDTETVCLLRRHIFRAIARQAVDNKNNSSLSKEQNKDVQTEMHYAGKKAIVVGAGPAGSIAASFLAKQGFHVDVYEKRRDPVQFEAVPDRSISLVLSRETANVIKDVGLELPGHGEGYVNGIHPFLGGSIFTSNGEVSFKGDKNGRFLAERHDLAKHLVDCVRKKNPEITLHFERSCDGTNLSKQEIHFRDQDNNIVKQDYDILVGADGANPEVRKAMQEQMKNFKIYAAPRYAFYKSYRDITIDLEKVPKKYKILFEAGHIAFCRDAKRKDGTEGLRAITFGQVANGMLSGSFSGTKTGFESIKYREKDYLNEIFPDNFPKEWIDQAVPTLVDNPMHKVPSTTEVSSLVGPSVVLIGDAGHTVSPTIGLGCNMAIQDSQALNDALQFAKGDIKAALEKFNDVRYKEVKECLQLEKFASAVNGDQKGLNQLLLFLLAKIHNMYHLVGNKYVPQLIPDSVVRRFAKQEISVKEAIQALQLELASFLVVFAIILFGSFKTIVNIL